MVAIFVGIALALVYGLGTLWFAWWDGGILRRILIGICVVVIGYAFLIFLQHHRNYS